VLRNATSVGFVRACNQGAERASGRLLCFLNSDALVQPGWLPHLERLLEDERVGAVVPMLLNEDGSVQEAGGIVGREGATAPLGRGRSPDDPEWSFLREVDYGSAACLVVRRAAFAELGGFDEAYAPAYYEDADLCLRLADRGLRTVVEPRSRVTHLQYGSGSVDAAVEQVRRNRSVFLERWGDRLSRRPIVGDGAGAPHRALAFRDAIALIRILVLGDAELAGRLRRLWIAARITLAGEGAGEGVESAPRELDGWLDRRRFHYSAIVSLAEPDRETAGALARSQPQAPVVVLGRDEDPIRSLAAVGVAPPSAEPRG
jgi:GT2 family glycosyltransferase